MIQAPSINCVCVDLMNVSETRDKLQQLPNDITMVVNNAGVAKLASFLDVTEEDFDT